MPPLGRCHTWHIGIFLHQSKKSLKKADQSGHGGHETPCYSECCWARGGDAFAVTVTSAGVISSGAGTKTKPASSEGAVCLPIPSPPVAADTSASRSNCALPGLPLLEGRAYAEFALSSAAAAAAAAATAPAAPTSPNTAIAAAAASLSSDGGGRRLCSRGDGSIGAVADRMCGLRRRALFEGEGICDELRGLVPPRGGTPGAPAVPVLCIILPVLALEP